MCLVEVSRWGWSRIPTHLGFCLETALHVLAQVIDILLCHAKFQIHPDHIVFRVTVCLCRRDDSDVPLLHRPDDRASVDRVAGESVDFPTEDSIGFTFVQAVHHGIEHRSYTRCFGRLCFCEDLQNLDLVFGGKTLEFNDLGVD